MRTAIFNFVFIKFTTLEHKILEEFNDCGREKKQWKRKTSLPVTFSGTCSLLHIIPVSFSYLFLQSLFVNSLWLFWCCFFLIVRNCCRTQWFHSWSAFVVEPTNNSVVVGLASFQRPYMVYACNSLRLRLRWFRRSQQIFVFHHLLGRWGMHTRIFRIQRKYLCFVLTLCTIKSFYSKRIEREKNIFTLNTHTHTLRISLQGFSPLLHRIEIQHERKCSSSKFQCLFDALCFFFVYPTFHLKILSP